MDYQFSLNTVWVAVILSTVVAGKATILVLYGQKSLRAEVSEEMRTVKTETAQKINRLTAAIGSQHSLQAAAQSI